MFQREGSRGEVNTQKRKGYKGKETKRKGVTRKGREEKQKRKAQDETKKDLRRAKINF